MFNQELRLLNRLYRILRIRMNKAGGFKTGWHRRRIMSEESFTVAGQSNPTITTVYGAFLALWGIVVSLISDSDSITSYAPTIAGVPLLISGVLANKIPEKRKLWMHIAATFGLICVLGGTRFFMVMGDGIDYASGSMLMLFLTGSIYTYFCVQSFIWARKQREAAEA